MQDRSSGGRNNTADGWGWWRTAYRALGLFIILAYGYRAVTYFLVDLPRYNARSAAAQQNGQFLASYNTRRTGDVITISGTAVPLSYPGTKAPKAFARIDLSGMAFTVALSGNRAPICTGDFVAASGTYHYDPQGGTLWISDPANISREFRGYIFRLDFLMLAFDSNWCGFPGMPINDY